MSEEEPLRGGNTTTVVRVGDTVRRPIGPWTLAVHDLLRHLAEVGFAGSPRVLRVDESNREILEFVPGEMGILSPAEPLPAWFRTPEASWAIGRWIRAFQSAQAGLALDVAKPWRRAPGALLRPGQLIVHHDVSPYNTVRRFDGAGGAGLGLRPTRRRDRGPGLGRVAMVSPDGQDLVARRVRNHG